MSTSSRPTKQVFQVCGREIESPPTRPADPFAIATDLEDLEGDGDLDWITSSFGVDRRLVLIDSGGDCAFEREFPAPSASSCGALRDVDDDRDRNLSFIDTLPTSFSSRRTSAVPPSRQCRHGRLHSSRSPFFVELRSPSVARARIVVAADALADMLVRKWITATPHKARTQTLVAVALLSSTLTER